MRAVQRLVYSGARGEGRDKQNYSRSPENQNTFQSVVGWLCLDIFECEDKTGEKVRPGDCTAGER